jgi:hypothetical protein
MIVYLLVPASEGTPAALIHPIVDHGLLGAGLSARF